MVDKNAIISFNVQATGPDLHLKVSIDERVVYDKNPTSVWENVCYEFDDSLEGQHLVRFVLSGKQSDHTQLDSNGNILTDRTVHVSDLTMGDIALGNMLPRVAEYQHNHNGTTDPVTEPFHGIMGCNGKVEIQFSTPVYLWLLENMWR